MSDFDFWVGSWRGAWTSDDGTGTAVNVVTKALDGKVVLEEFTADAPETLRGLSVSVRDETNGTWKQTWVDNTGSYLDFTGGTTGEGMDLRRNALTADGEPFEQRMLWTAIAGDRFEWYWQRRRAENDWQTQWHITYTRIG